MVDKQQIEYEVETDATSAVRSVQAVSRELASVTGNVALLEQRLRQILTGTIPQQTKELAGYLERISTSAVLPPNLNSINRAARNIAGGGTQTVMTQAAYRGVVNTLKTDPAYQTVQYEKEATKVAQARFTLYQRMRAALPDTADEKQVVDAWRKVLDSMGGAPDVHSRAARRKWLEESRQEALRLDKQITADHMREVNARIDMEQRAYERYARRAATNLSKIEDANARRLETTAVVNRLQSFANRRASPDFKFDQGRIESVINDEVQRRDAIKVNQPPKVVDQQAKIRRRVDDATAFMEYEGGSAVMGMQARYMANSTALYTVMSTLSTAAKGTVDLEAGLKDLQAITSATDMDMAKLEATIKQTGATSKYSLTEIAEGAKVMAQAGFSASQISQALPSIMNYAAATGTEVKQAVETTTSVLSQFDLSIERTAQVTDIMTNGLNKSKLNSEQLALAIQYAGNQAALSNMSFEDMVSALGAMANAGIRSGSTLGTGLRAVLAEFEHPSKKFQENLAGIGLTTEDVSLKTNSLTEIIKTLSSSGFTYADALGSFDKRASAAFFALQNNVSTMEAMQKTITNSGSSMDAAGIQMESFNSQWQRLSNTLVSVVSTGGEPILNLITGIVAGTANLLAATEPLGPALKIVTTGFTALAAAGTLRWLLALGSGVFTTTNLLKLMGVQAVATSAGTSTLAFTSGAATTGVRALSAALLASPMVVFTGAIMVAVGAMEAYNYAQNQSNKRIEEFRTAAGDASAEADKYGTRMEEIEKTINSVTDRHASLAQNTQLAQQAAENARAKFGAWGLQLQDNLSDVNNLITGLVNLKSKMAEVRLAKLEEQRTNLQLENKELGKQGKDIFGRDKLVSDAKGVIATQGNYLKRSDPELHAALIKISRGQGVGDISTLTQTKALLDRAMGGKLPYGSQNRFGALQEGLAGATSRAVKRAENDVTISLIDDQTLQPIIESRSSKLIGKASLTQGRFNDEQRRINQIKDPTQRRREQIALDDQRKAAATDFVGTDLKAQTAELMSNPATAAKISSQASLQGLTPEQVVAENLKGSAQVNKLLAGGRKYGAIRNIEVLQAENRKLDAQMKAKTISPEDYKASKKELSSALVSLQNPDWNAETQEAYVQEEIGTADAKSQMGGRGGGGRGDSVKAKTASSRAKSIAIQIERAASSLGPTPDDMLAGQEKLAELLRQWEEARKAQISAESQGASSSDLQSRLDDLKVEAEQFRDKILQGNVAAAKDLIARSAEVLANDTKSVALLDINRNGGGLQENLQKVTVQYEKLMTARLDATTASFVASNPGVDTSTSAQLQGKLAEVTRDGQSKIIDVSIEVIRQFYETAAREARSQIQIERDKLDLEDVVDDAYGTVASQKNRGETQRILAGRRREERDVTRAGLEVRAIETDIGLNTGEVEAKQFEFDKATDPAAREKIGQELIELKERARELDAELKKAKATHDGLSGKTDTYKNNWEAITSGFKAFRSEKDGQKPLGESLADGTLETLKIGSAAWKEYYSTMIKGAATSKEAFANMRTSVTQQLKMLAIQIITDQAIRWVLAMFGQTLPGSTPSAGKTTTTSSFTKRAVHGGPIRMTGGGGIPNRDSVDILAEPGEFMLRKSAVQMIGEDKLTAINAMGNRRMSSMPSIQQAMPQREPDTANVWIVPPGTQPAVGKKDVVAYVADNIMSNGQLKKLIKSVSLGNS